MPAASGADTLRSRGGVGIARLTLPRPALAAIAVFGATGLILSVVLLVGLLRVATTAGGLAHQQHALVELAESGRATAADARAAAERAEAGVTATADAADRAAGFITELAGALQATSASLRVDVLGNQPFAEAADRVARAADQADQTAAGLTAAAAEARQGAAQLHTVTADLGRIADAMNGMRAGLSASGLDDGSLAVLEVALIALVVWLAIPAAVCLWLGVTLWRRADPRPRRAPRQEPVR